MNNEQGLHDDYFFRYLIFIYLRLILQLTFIMDQLFSQFLPAEPGNPTQGLYFIRLSSPEGSSILKLNVD